MIYLNALVSSKYIGQMSGLIFDCDGVLIDSLEANAFYYNSFKKYFGLSALNDVELKYVHSHNVWESLCYILPQELHEQATEYRSTFDYRTVLPYIHIEEGLFNFLRWARSYGFRMGIATSRTDTLDIILDYFGLDSFFYPCITSSKVRNPKPNPESLHAILDAWRMPPRDVVFIGDSQVDEYTAQNAGLRFWAYKNPRLQSAQLYIPDFRTLLRCMAQSLR